jgi:chitodextrinase
MMRTPPVFTAVLFVLAILFGWPRLSAQARDRTPPTMPTNLTVTATTETTAMLSWGASTDNSGKFLYYITGVPGPPVPVPQTNTTHTLTGLTPGTTYGFRVTARDFSGNNSKTSNTATVTLPGTVPGAPTKPVVQLVDVGPTHVSLTWASTDNGPTIWYTAYINGQMVASSNARAGTFTCASVMVPTYCIPIDQSTTYAFTVRARDNEGKLSPVSDPLVVTTLPADPTDQSPPTPPANITVQDTGGFLLVSF